MKDQEQLLINILLDRTAREDERGDAAIDLRLYSDSRALEALTTIASDPDEDDLIVDNCAESIGEIYISTNVFNSKLFAKLTPFAQRIVFTLVETRNPKLINDSLRKELNKKFNLGCY